MGDGFRRKAPREQVGVFQVKVFQLKLQSGIHHDRQSRFSLCVGTIFPIRRVARFLGLLGGGRGGFHRFGGAVLAWLTGLNAEALRELQSRFAKVRAIGRV